MPIQELVQIKQSNDLEKNPSRDDGGQLCTGDQGKQGFESDHSDNAGVLHDPEACAGNRDFLSSSKNQSE